MACSSCGMPCQGDLCRDCGRMDHQEDYYGVTSDHAEEIEEVDA